MPNTSIELPDDMADDLDRVAYERSSPDDRVSRSQVIREAIREFLDDEDAVAKPVDDLPEEAQATN